MPKTIAKQFGLDGPELDMTMNLAGANKNLKFHGKLR